MKISTTSTSPTPRSIAVFQWQNPSSMNFFPEKSQLLPQLPAPAWPHQPSLSGVLGTQSHLRDLLLHSPWAAREACWTSTFWSGTGVGGTAIVMEIYPQHMLGLSSETPSYKGMIIRGATPPFVDGDWHGCCDMDQYIWCERMDELGQRFLWYALFSGWCFQPLWKICISQLGWWNSQLIWENKIDGNQTTNQFSFDTWRCPEIAVPLNHHPFMGFSMK